MQSVVELKGLRQSGEGARRAALPFAAACSLALLGAGALAGWAPVGLSVVTVFLFAGPHNWFEFRYFVSRLPVSWGQSRNFFATAIAGVVLLTAGYAALPLLGSALVWSGSEWSTAAAVWNSLLIGWVALLVLLRGRLSPRRDWSWALPVGSSLVALNWLAPYALSLALVYLHPLVALWFLDRQLLRTRRSWSRAYRLCLLALPVVLCALWWKLAAAPPLLADDELSLRIVRHAGADMLAGVSSHLLVSTHVFLETLHYGVWLVAMPLAGAAAAPWRLRSIPLVRHPRGWPRLVVTALVLGAAAVIALWLCFAADYPTTRDIYFTVAVAHVLAEVPFLLRML